MYISRKLLVPAVMVIVLIFSAPTRAANSGVENLGEICFHMGSETLQVSILSYGTDYFSVSGKIGQIPVHGTAILLERELRMTLTGSDIYLLAITYTISVNLDTLSGIYTRIVDAQLIDFPGGEGSDFTTGVDGGYMIVTPCP